MDGRFNQDTAALERRADINAVMADHDLEEWILQQIPPVHGKRILDLGCGTGKQVFRLAPLVGPGGSILGIDASADAVRLVNERAVAEGVRFVEARRVSFDDCGAALAGMSFDLIMSSYAIYYAGDQEQLLQYLASLVAHAGTVFICGPGHGTNAEIVDVVNGVLEAAAPRSKPESDFISARQIERVAAGYRSSTVARLENRIRFDSVESVLTWWQNHNSFIPAAAEGVERHLVAHFDSNATFPLTKHVLGVRFDG